MTRLEELDFQLYLSQTIARENPQTFLDLMTLTNRLSDLCEEVIEEWVKSIDEELNNKDRIRTKEERKLGE